MKWTMVFVRARKLIDQHEENHANVQATIGVPYLYYLVSKFRSPHQCPDTKQIYGKSR